MISRVVPHILLILLLSASGVLAQPTLPDISASIDNNGVLLSWTNQYTTIKAISVLRSKDSTNDFEVIGYVKNTESGTHSFMDNHPMAGRNYYKLAIVFNTGLTWRSNHVGVFVARIEPETPQPAAEKRVQSPSQLESSFRDRPRKLPDTCKKPGNIQPRVSISADTGTTPLIPRPKVHLSFDDQADNTPIFMHSRYIHTDSATGHVDMFLPEDISTHLYSVKFYDKDRHVIMEVPKINSAKIIIDKRNFQRKGVYKFALRKDFLEIESGYIIVDP